MKFVGNHSSILSNEQDRDQCIKLLLEDQIHDCHCIEQSSADADTLNVSTGLEVATNYDYVWLPIILMYL